MSLPVQVLEVFDVVVVVPVNVCEKEVSVEVVCVTE